MFPNRLAASVKKDEGRVGGSGGVLRKVRTLPAVGSRRIVIVDGRGWGRGVGVGRVIMRMVRPVLECRDWRWALRRRASFVGRMRVVSEIWERVVDWGGVGGTIGAAGRGVVERRRAAVVAAMVVGRGLGGRAAIFGGWWGRWERGGVGFGGERKAFMVWEV